VVLHCGYGLPEWVGPADLIVAVSASGSTEETLSAVEEAARRGARLVTVGAPDSPLSARCGAGWRRHVPVDSAGQQPRARLWSLAVPVLAAADAAGVISVSAEVLSAVADRLDRLADRCRPAVDRAANPAKALAGHLAGGLPLVWGSTRLAGVAATRFGCQLNENAQVPAVTGELPEATHNQIVVLDGPYRRDLRMVLLRDAGEPPELARRRAVCLELAESRGVEVADVPAEGRHPLERLASLIAVTDYASVYLALLLGVDPTPIWPITYLKERIAGD
jgi:glucose/mannose-6-phosphate isomerase